MNTRKTSSKAGYTLAELITTIVILTLVTAIAIPSIFAIKSSIEMRALNDTARQIFMAAQNTLTGMNAAGVQDIINDTDNVITVGSDQFLILDEDDPTTEFLLPRGSIEPEVYSHNYILKVNATHNAVLEVYYSEETDLEKGNLADYADANTRKELRIGFYDGSDDDLPYGEAVEAPVMEIINNDQLKVKIRHEISNTLTLRIEELDANGRPVADPSKVRVITQSYTPVDGYNEFILDSLFTAEPWQFNSEHLRFKDLFENFTPGADLRITAVFSRSGYVSSFTSKKVNSLFAKREGDTVYVSSGRHLQNLHAAFSGVDIVTEDAGGTPTNKFKAVQIPDEDTKSTELIWNPNKGSADPAYASAYTYFTSIENDTLMSYDGGGNLIRNLESRTGGLISTISGNSQLEGGTRVYNKKLSNIRLVDPIIETNSGDHTGALVNYANNIEVSNCGIYAVEKKNSASSAGLSRINAENNKYVGGLIGLADSCSVKDSFAALPQIAVSTPPSGGTSVGGLIGYAQTSGSLPLTISGSYAATSSLSASDNGNAAGFIGFSNGADGQNITINKCYAVGTIYTPDNDSGGALKIYGFAGGTIKSADSSYSAVIHESTEILYQHHFAKADSTGLISNCYYMGGASENDTAQPLTHEDLSYKGAEPARNIFNKLGDASKTKWNNVTASYPYAADLASKNYPFPALLMSNGLSPHYGDWPKEHWSETPEGGLTAFNKETGGQPIEYVICPKGKSTQFWISNVGENNTETAVEIDPSKTIVREIHGNNIQTNQTSEIDIINVADPQPGTARSKVSLSSKNNASYGVYAIHLETTDGKKKWVLVIVCDYTLTLTGNCNGHTESKTNAINTAVFLSMDSGEDAEFTATLSHPSPTYNTLRGSLNNVNAAITNFSGAPANPLSDETKQYILDNWNTIMVADGFEPADSYGPGVSTNLTNSVTAKNDVNNFSPYSAAIGGPLEINAKSAGSARVSACWAIDKINSQVDIDVLVDGGRIAISSAEAVDNSDNPIPNAMGVLPTSNMSLAGISNEPSDSESNSELEAESGSRISYDPDGMISKSAKLMSEATVSLAALGDRMINQADDFPYMLNINPTPSDNVVLQLTPAVTRHEMPDSVHKYDWRVTCVDSSDPENLKVSTASEEEKMILDNESIIQQPVSIPLDYLYTKASYSKFLVELIYHCTPNSGGPEYTATDFMYVTCTRTTNQNDDYNGANISLNRDRVDLEQVNYNADFQRQAGWPDSLMKAEVMGCVDNVYDTQLVWYLEGDGNQKTLISGTEGEIPVIQGGAEIARLSWNHNEKNFSSGGGTKESNGGTVTITAEDSSYYGDEDDNPLTFTLIAQARDNGEDAEYKRVTVNIMPKLRLNPQSQSTMGPNGVVDDNYSPVFKSNRNNGDNSSLPSMENVWAEPTCNTTNGNVPYSNLIYSSDNSKLTLVLKKEFSRDEDRRTLNIKLQYGPYKENGNLFINDSDIPWLSGSFGAIINKDGGIPKSTDSEDSDAEYLGYFLVEKGKIRYLDLSWTFVTPWFYVSENYYNLHFEGKQPDFIIDTIKQDTNHTRVGNKDIVGHQQYSIEGRTLGYTPMKWSSQIRWIPKTYKYPFANLYIVGTEFGNEDDMVFDGQDASSQSLTVRTYFPHTSVIRSGTPDQSMFVDSRTLELSFTDPDQKIVSIDGSSSDGSRTVIIKQPSASDPDKDAYADVNNTFTINPVPAVEGGKYGTTTLKATYTVVQTENGETKTHTYNAYKKITVKPSNANLKLVVEPCTEADRAELIDRFGSDKVGSNTLIAGLDINKSYTINNTTGNFSVVNENVSAAPSSSKKYLPTIITDPRFGCDSLYLKAYFLDTDTDARSPNYNHYDLHFTADRRLTGIGENDISYPDEADEAVTYIRLTPGEYGRTNSRINPVVIDFTAKFGTLTAKQPVQVVQEPSVIIYDDSQTVVTNKSKVELVASGENNTLPPQFSLTAKLKPAVNSLGSDGQTFTPIDRIIWYPEYPSGALMGSGPLAFTPDANNINKTTVTTIFNPGGKVAITAQSEKALNTSSSRSAYALVFVPELIYSAVYGN